MTGNNHDERWKELCEAIVREPDSKRLMELVEKLNRILEEREGESKRRTEIKPSSSIGSVHKAHNSIITILSSSRYGPPPPGWLRPAC